MTGLHGLVRTSLCACSRHRASVISSRALTSLIPNLERVRDAVHKYWTRLMRSKHASGNGSDNIAGCSAQTTCTVVFSTSQRLRPKTTCSVGQILPEQNRIVHFATSPQHTVAKFFKTEYANFAVSSNGLLAAQKKNTTVASETVNSRPAKATSVKLLPAPTGPVIAARRIPMFAPPVR